MNDLATIEEAQQQLSTERENLAKARQDVQSTEQQLSSQRVLRQSKGMSNLMQRKLAREQINVTQQQIAQREVQLQEYEQQIQQAKAAEEAQRQENQRQQKIYDAYLMGKQGRDLSAFINYGLNTKAEREAYQEGYAEFQAGVANIQESKKPKPAIDYTTYVKDVGTEKQGYSIAPELAEELNKQKPVTSVQTETKEYHVLEAPKKETTSEYIERQIAIKSSSPVVESIKGISKPFVESYSFVKGLATDTTKTFGGLVTGVGAFGRQSVDWLLLRKGESPLAGVGQVLQERPLYATGYVFGSYIQIKAPEIIVKGYDIARTAKLSKLPAENIIAPEFPAQKYPLIKPGQTAGELLEEFKPRLPGETRPGGFTASPNPIRGALQKGSSELPGGYQSPLLNPTFLKVSSEEKKLFSWNPFPTLKPTASYITPTSYKFPPGINAGTNVPKPGLVNSIKEYFINKAEKGASYVTFIKREKESVIPFGTDLAQKTTRYYIKYKGRRIPIEEFDTVAGAANKLETGSALGKVRKVEELYSSSRYLKSEAILDPYRLLIASSVARSPTQLVSSQPSSSSKASSSSVVSSSIIKSSSRVPKDSSSTNLISSRTEVPSSGSSVSSIKSSILSGSSSVRYGGSSSTTPRTPPSEPPSYPSNYGGTNERIKRLISKVKQQQAYDVFVKSRGKWKKIADDLPRNAAEKKGADYVLKKIESRFKIVADSKATPKGKDIEYEPNPDVFRNYEIRKDKRIPLKDEWIQKSGTKKEPTIKGARLASGSERKELFGFKKVKSSLFNTGKKRGAF